MPLTFRQKKEDLLQEKKKSRPSEIERDLLSKALPRKLTAVQCEDLASEVREDSQFSNMDLLGKVY